ncbi:unnamed protein product [Lathyrus sativus]|nr:unnamed protein product [Lathyrus sativus]
MEHIQQEQAAFREELDSMKGKIDQILEAILVARREEEQREATAVVNNGQGQGSTAIPLVPIPKFHGMPLNFNNAVEGNTPQPIPAPGVTIGAIPQAQPTVVQIPAPHTEDTQMDQYDDVHNYHAAIPIASPVASQDFEAMKMCRDLAEKLRAMEGHNLNSFSALELCLVPDVVIPSKFKVPEFSKYKGLSCPNIHLKMYCRKMAAYARDERLMIHCFQDSLSGASLKWYMQLERNSVHTWAELADAFVKQYKYNTDLAPNHTQLQSMTQKDSESFKEYAQRWRELAARVHPPLVDRELIDIFMGTLQGQYYEKMIGSVSAGFSDLVIVDERIEEGMKSGKIPGGSNNQANAKKPFNEYKKKEGETNAISLQKGQASQQAPAPMPYQVPYYQYPYVAAAQYAPMPYQPAVQAQMPQQQAYNQQGYQYPPQQQAYNHPILISLKFGCRTLSHHSKTTIPKEIQEKACKQLIK